MDVSHKIILILLNRFIIKDQVLVGRFPPASLGMLCMLAVNRSLSDFY